MLQLSDWLVIAFYLVFMLALGPIFKSFTRNASDYFRSGGTMTWWIAAASMFMTGFTAWTYTGAAGKIFQTGIFFLTLTISNFFAAMFTVFFTAHKFRQMRVITCNEAIRNRFGKANEQINTWLPLPFNIMFGGIGLYTISMFMSCVFSKEMQFLKDSTWGTFWHSFGLDGAMAFLILILMSVIIIMTMLGGSWAATAGDFVQMVILVVVSIAIVFCVLYGDIRIDHQTMHIDGLSGLLSKIKEHPNLTDVSSISRWWIFVPYFITLILNQTILQNSLNNGASKFIFVKNGNDARRISAISWLIALPHTCIFMIPPLVCAVFFSLSDLQSIYPNLANAQEAAYIHIAALVLPQGLLGLLICSIFAATLTSMNSGLNATSASIVRNIYLPLFNPHADDKLQLKIGRLCTVIIGILYIFVALFFSTLKNMPLYELILLASTSTGIPQAVPLLLGMFHRKAPDFAAWSTLAIGFAVSILLTLYLNVNLLNDWFHSYALTANELNDLKLAITTGILIGVCVLWFYGCILFKPGQKSKFDEARVNKFFDDMNRPISKEEGSEDAYNSDSRQFKVIGKLCIVYGISILLLLFFFNPLGGRLCIIGCGGFMTTLGICLLTIGFRKEKLTRK